MHQRHRHKHHHAHGEHHIGDLQRAETLAGLVAECIVGHIAGDRKEQKQQSQKRHLNLAAQIHQQHADDTKQRTQHLPQTHTLTQDQHIHQNTHHRHHGNDRARYGRGGIENAVAFKNEVQRGLHNAQQQQFTDGFAPQGKGKQRLAADLAHQRVYADQQRHHRKGRAEAKRQQHRRRCDLQRHFGKHKAEAENGRRGQRSQQCPCVRSVFH